MSSSNRPGRPCLSCGKTTHAEGYLCRLCRPSVAKRPERDCLSCGKTTTATSQMCPACRPTPTGSRRRDCTVCGIGRTSGLLCEGCCDARKDDESPWDLQASGGYWRLTGGIKEWVPLLVQAETTPEADGTRECEYGGCGVWFVRRKVTQRYCSKRCQKAAGNARQRDEVAA